MTDAYLKDISYRTSRSGGSGGQNVNKVESAVEAILHIAGSSAFNDEQRELLQMKLKTRINSAGELTVRSTSARTQRENKTIATKRLQALISGAFILQKKRKKTGIPALAKKKRLDDKKRQSEIKSFRRKPEI